MFTICPQLLLSHTRQSVELCSLYRLQAARLRAARGATERW